MKKIRPYPETHKSGVIMLENVPTDTLIEGDLGIMIAEDGRVWICIDGLAFLRFSPHPNGKMQKQAPSRGRKLTDEERAVLICIGADPLTAKEISDSSGVALYGVMRAIRSLKYDGLVARRLIKRDGLRTAFYRTTNE